MKIYSKRLKARVYKLFFERTKHLPKYQMAELFFKLTTEVRI